MMGVMESGTTFKEEGTTFIMGIRIPFGRGTIPFKIGTYPLKKCNTF